MNFAKEVATIVNVFGSVVSFFFRTRDLGVFGDVSFAQIMLGASLTAYIGYQFVAWLSDIAT